MPLQVITRFLRFNFHIRLRKFNENPTHPAKGPFSYSIEVDIDAYHKSLGLSVNADQAGAGAGAVAGAVTGVSVSHQPSSDNSLKETLTDTQSSQQPVTPKSRYLIASSDEKNQNHSSESASSDVNALHSLGNDSVEHSSKDSLEPSLKQSNKIGLEGISGGYIHELREDILHSLVDSTNPRLNIVCSGKGAKKVDGENIGKGMNSSSSSSMNMNLKGSSSNSHSNGIEGIPSWAIKSCEKVRSKKFFSPSESTIAVHMWTHTFLGWSFFRGMYNSGVYAAVERELVPSMHCPRADSYGENGGL